MTAHISDQNSMLAMLKNLLNESDNWLNFASFMHHALYDPKFGYYTGFSQKFGPQGDFITAPEISDLFGKTIARQIAQCLSLTGGSVLEIGGGSGVLGADLLIELQRIEAPLDEYLFFEPSPTLSQRQQNKISDVMPRISNKARWINEIPKSFTGVILANEVFDALPVHLLSLNDGGWRERGVSLENESLFWKDLSLKDPRLLEAVKALDVQPPYVTEVCLAANGLVEDLSQALRKGVILALDYGYERTSYYHPDRSDGTLACYYRHRADGNPLDRPGQKDITAHVDFTRLAEAAIDAELEISGYATQADFLVNCGITEFLQEIDPGKSEIYLPAVSAVQKLLSPSAMGDMFKVMSFSRGINEPLIGFSHRDRRHML